jgi:hypothetical protein
MPAGFFQEFTRNSPRTWNTNAEKDTEGTQKNIRVILLFTSGTTT